MKIKLISAIVLFTMFCGCKKDPLDITPDGRMSIEDIFKNEIQTGAYLNTVYSCIPKYFKFYSSFQFIAGLTDEAKDSETGNTQSMAAQWNAGVLTPSYNPMAAPGAGPGAENTDFYTAFWKGIRHSNVFLANIVNTPFANPDTKERFKVEARLLRAFFYLELVKQFGPLPVITEPFDPAFNYTTLKRPTFQEVTDFVVSECDAIIASESLPIRLTQAWERERFSKAVAYAVKSEILLYNASPLWNPSNDQAKWTKAAAGTRQALTDLVSKGYELYPYYEEYFQNYRQANVAPDRETIYEISNAWFIPLTTVGIPSKEGSFMIGAQPSQELVDAYDMAATGQPAILGYLDEDHLKPIINPTSGYDEENPYEGRDPRFYATVWYNGALYDNINGKIHTIETFLGGADQLLKSPPNRINTHTGYYLRKFIDPSIPINSSSNAQYKKYRLAEIYLNFAEAENEAFGPNSDVYGAMKKIRNRVNMPDLPAGLTKEGMRERIRRERRVELAWEEHRFWDVRRWKILDKTDKVVTGMEIKVPSAEGRVNILNPGFESGLTGWSVASAVAANTGHTGSKSAEIVGDQGAYMEQIIPVLPNTTYVMTAWIKVTAGTGYIGVNGYGGGELNTPSSSAAWTKITHTFITGPTNTTARIFSWWPGGNGYVDDFDVRMPSAGGGGSITYTRFVTDRRNAWQNKFMIFPIPLTDASIIPDFRQNQNPGW